MNKNSLTTPVRSGSTLPFVGGVVILDCQSERKPRKTQEETSSGRKNNYRPITQGTRAWNASWNSETRCHRIR